MLKHFFSKEDYCIDLTQKARRECNAIKKIHADINSSIKNTHLPPLIIAETLPSQSTIEGALFEFSKRGVAAEDVTMIILEGDGDNRTLLWEIIQTGLKDIYYWAGEDDVKDYIIHSIQRKQKISSLLESALVKENLIGESPVWRNFLSRLIEASLFSQCSFLLIGESGTGKELISRLIHTIDTRADKKDLILVDCTTIVPELSGSELFGHERGSFTNALQNREGAFALANRGTLFLDEIGELQPSLQAGLLRVIQEGTYKKIGSNTWQKTDFRLVCATHRNLRHQIEENKFRQDLFYRIADVEFRVPTLSERKEDIPLIADYYLKQFSKGNDAVEFDNSVMDFLKQRMYPGNVRELRQLIQRITLKHVRHKKITIGELPEEERNYMSAHSTANNNTDSLDAVVTQMIRNGDNYTIIKDKVGLAAFEAAIAISGGNKQKAAERLGIDVRTVQLGVRKNQK